MIRRRVLVCEPYATTSHLAWAEGLAAHSRHDVEVLTHPGTSWKWRMQGAALTMAEQVTRAVDGRGRPDAVVVSDMVHLPALLGLARRAVADVPVVLYLHENQLTYPLQEGAEPDHTYAMTNWLSMAAADRVVFNSDHHRRAVLEALPGLLDRFPDRRHGHLVGRVAERCAVVPVGVDPTLFELPARTAAEPEGVPLVLWNHRWEYDTCPEVFFGALTELATDGVAFDVAVAGQSFRAEPPVFADARRALGARVVHFGTAERAAYVELLGRADVVVSTSVHEFFGIAVVEAVAAGALGVLPRRLSYPELVADPATDLHDDGDLVEALRWALTDHDGRRAAARRARVHVERFAWPTVAAAHDALIDEVVDAAR